MGVSLFFWVSLAHADADTFGAFDNESGAEATTLKVLFGGDEVGATDPSSMATVRLEVQLKASQLEGLPISHCTGTLIDPSIVLTAAHCVQAFQREEVTQRARLVVFSRRRDSTIQTREMKAFVIHPGYSDPEGFSTSAFDIALIQLTEPMAQVRRADLAEFATEADFVQGSDVLVAGHGENDRGTRAVHEDPQIVALMLESSRLSNSPRDQLRKTRIVRSMVARLRELSARPLLIARLQANLKPNLWGGRMLELVGQQSGVCKGDSGGPSFLLRPNEPRPLIIGVHSLGGTKNCDGDVSLRIRSAFGVFVPDFVDWIRAESRKLKSRRDL